jgi:hypothetical protein
MSRKTNPITAADFDPVPLTFAGPAAITFEAPDPQKRGAVLPPPRRVTTTPRTRRFLDLRGQTDAARRLLSPLPQAGETVHALVGGEFVTAACVPVLCDLVGEPVALTAASLGINDASVDLILRLVTEGKLTRFDLVLSDYFARADRQTADRVIERLRAAGQRAAITRSHAKLLCFEPVTLADRYTISGSGNLRSSMNLETLDLSNCPQLCAFHRRWIGDLLDNQPTTTN